MEPDMRGIWPTLTGNSPLSWALKKSGRCESPVPDNEEIFSRAGPKSKKPLMEEQWTKAKMMFLMDSDLSSLPASPISPDLVALFLQRNYLIRVIPDSFFNHMPSLQALNLSRTRIKSLPLSIFDLESLRVLILRDCERLFVLPIEIGNLKKLVIFDLQGTNIRNLPNEVCKLYSLKQLQVSFYGSSDRSECAKLPRLFFPLNVISRWPVLEKLSIDVYPGDERWSKSVKTLVQEMANLKHLTALNFYFPEVDILKLFLQVSPTWRTERLKLFNFVVGHDSKRLVSRVSPDVETVYGKQGQCLRYVNNKEIMPDAVAEVLMCATAFYLEHNHTIRSLSDIETAKINGLKVCVLRECPEILCIIQGKDTSNCVLPFLEHLSIHNLWNLRTIWEGTLPSGSFGRLRTLSVHACPKLKFILTVSMLHYVNQLEELMVEDCPNIKDIIVEDGATTSMSKSHPSLKKLRLHYLPQLVSVWKGSWPLLERLSFYNCSNLKNIGLDAQLRDSITEIHAEKDWWEELQWEDAALSLHLQACFSPIYDSDF